MKRKNTKQLNLFSTTQNDNFLISSFLSTRSLDPVMNQIIPNESNELSINTFDILSNCIFTFDFQLNKNELKTELVDLGTFNIYNIHTDSTYIPSYPGLEGKNKICNCDYYNKNNYNSIELLGTNQTNLSTYIDYIKNLYNITEDNLKNLNINLNFDINDLNKKIYGRVFEDYQENEKNIINEYTNEILKPNISNRNFSPISLEWKIDLKNDFSEFVESNQEKLKKLKFIIFNINSFSNKPIIANSFDKISSDNFTGSQSYDVQDISNFKKSQISSSISSDIWVAGTYNYFNKEVNFPIVNQINGISAVFAKCEFKQNEKLNLKIKFDLKSDIDVENFKILPKTLKLLIYNSYDLTMYKYYHFLDYYGFNGLYNKTKNEHPDFEDKYIQNKIAGKFVSMLSGIELSSFSDISNVPNLSGFFKNLSFKMDEDVYFDFNDPQFYYPGYNDKAPFRIVNLIDSLFLKNTYDTQTSSQINLLENIWNSNNLFINQIDNNLLLKNLDQIQLDKILDSNANLLRVFEDFESEDLISSNVSILSSIHFFEKNVTKKISCEISLNNGNINNTENFLDLKILENSEISGNFKLFKTEELNSNLSKKEILNFSGDNFISSFIHENDNVNKFFNIYTSFEKNKETNNWILYFNYYNFILPPFIKYQNELFSIDILPDSYLKLKNPGDSGFLNIYLQFKQINNITKKVTAFKNLLVSRYKIYNLSDDKPKFLINKEFDISNFK